MNGMATFFEVKTVEPIDGPVRVEIHAEIMLAGKGPVVSIDKGQLRNQIVQSAAACCNLKGGAK